MAADNPHAVDSVTNERIRDSYVSPTVDFLMIAIFVSVLAVAGVAVILP